MRIFMLFLSCADEQQAVPLHDPGDMMSPVSFPQHLCDQEYEKNQSCSLARIHAHCCGKGITYTHAHTHTHTHTHTHVLCLYV